jgi:hypothetical protein
VYGFKICSLKFFPIYNLFCIFTKKCNENFYKNKV